MVVNKGCYGIYKLESIENLKVNRNTNTNPKRPHEMNIVRVAQNPEGGLTTRSNPNAIRRSKGDKHL